VDRWRLLASEGRHPSSIRGWMTRWSSPGPKEMERVKIFALPFLGEGGRVSFGVACAGPWNTRANKLNK
jgi:hypothetical protein